MQNLQFCNSFCENLEADRDVADDPTCARVISASTPCDITKGDTVENQTLWTLWDLKLSEYDRSLTESTTPHPLLPLTPPHSLPYRLPPPARCLLIIPSPRWWKAAIGLPASESPQSNLPDPLSSLSHTPPLQYHHHPPSLLATDSHWFPVPVVPISEARCTMGAGTKDKMPLIIAARGRERWRTGGREREREKGRGGRSGLQPRHSCCERE